MTIPVPSNTPEPDDLIEFSAAAGDEMDHLAVNDWLRANGFNPADVSSFSIHRGADGSRHVVAVVHLRNAQGRKYISENEDGTKCVASRVEDKPMVVDLADEVRSSRRPFRRWQGFRT